MKTVSRVINGEAHVRQPMRRRVEDAIAALGYRPNLAARQLAANRSYLILLLFNSFGASYATQIIVAAAAQCRAFDYHLVSEPIDTAGRTVDAIERTIARLRPEGVLLIPPLADDPMALAAIEATGTRLVRISGTIDGPGVRLNVDERLASCELVTHLIAEQGHQRVGFIGPRARHLSAQNRAQGYLDALELAGIPYDPELVVEGDFFFNSGLSGAERLFGLTNPPTAIFAANDGMALGAMSAAQVRGLSIPSDVAVAGFDDSPAGRMVWPPLTSVRQPFADLAQSAIRRLAGRSTGDADLQCTLLRRGSTTGAKLLAATPFDA